MLNNQRVQRMFMMLCSRDGERGLKWCHSNHPCNWLLPSYLAVGSMIAWLWKPMLLSSYGSVGWYGATPKKKDTHADHAPYLETSDFRVTINRSNMFLRCINSMPLIVLVIVVIAQWARTHTQVLFLLGPHCPFLEVDCLYDTEKTYHPCMLCFCAFRQVVDILKTWGWHNMHLFQGVMSRPS